MKMLNLRSFFFIIAIGVILLATQNTFSITTGEYLSILGNDFQNKKFDIVYENSIRALKVYNQDDDFKVRIAYYAGASLGRMDKGFESDLKALEYFDYVIRNAGRLKFSQKNMREYFVADITTNVTLILNRYIMYTLFDFDSARIKPESFPKLDQSAKLLQTVSGVVHLIGHTDSKGNNRYNLDLSKRRANSVRSYLIDHGIDSPRIFASGKGEDEPIADNNTESGRALNRRVQVVYFNVAFNELPSIISKEREISESVDETSDIKNELNDAISLYRQSRPNGDKPKLILALSQIMNAYSKNTKDKKAIFWMGIVQKRSGKYQSAIKFFEKSKSHPDFEVEMALCHFLIEKYDASRHYASRALDRGSSGNVESAKTILSILSQDDAIIEKKRVQIDNDVRSFK